jgi:predicted dehydrogenase
MIGIGIVGYGYWGPNYLRILRQLGETNYLAVCDSDATRLESIKNTPIKRYTEYAAFLQDPNIHAIIIATPSPTHHKIALGALEADKHILVEKPVTLKAEHAKEIDEKAKQRNKVVLTGHIFLYNDGITFLKEHIHKQEFGKIHEIECIRQGHGPIRTEINVMWDLATHDISILLYLLEKMPITVAARGCKYRKETQQEDSVMLTLDFPDRTMCTIKVNWQYPVKERRVTVIGQNQMIRFSDTEQTAPISIYYKAAKPHGEISNPEYGAFKMITSDNGFHVPAVKIQEPLLLQIRDFLDAIQKKKQPKSDGILGIKVVQILEAAQESLQCDGKTVMIQ